MLQKPKKKAKRILFLGLSGKFLFLLWKQPYQNKLCQIIKNYYILFKLNYLLKILTTNSVFHCQGTKLFFKWYTISSTSFKIHSCPKNLSSNSWLNRNNRNEKKNTKIHSPCILQRKIPSQFSLLRNHQRSTEPKRPYVMHGMMVR